MQNTNLLYNCRVTTQAKQRALRALRHQHRGKYMEGDDPLVALMDEYRFINSDLRPEVTTIKYKPPCKSGNLRREPKPPANPQPEEFVCLDEELKKTKLYRAKNRHANTFRVRKCYQ